MPMLRKLKMCEVYKKNPLWNLTKSNKANKGEITRGDSLPIAHKKVSNGHPCLRKLKTPISFGFQLQVSAQAEQ